MGTVVVGSINLWASNGVTDSQMDNAVALEEGFFIACGGEGQCLYTCPGCHTDFSGDGGGIGNHGGVCPICGYDTPY